MEPVRDESGTPAQAQLGLWDTICIIIGIIIGTGIYRVPGEVFARSGGPIQALLLWAGGGVLAIAGAMCFAELSSTYPRSGGEYVYLSRAFGSWAGFLFAWGQLLFIRTGASMVIMAYVFADYVVRLTKIDQEWEHYAEAYVAISLFPIITLTATNIVGVRTGKWTQNILTTAKVLGLIMVLVAGFGWAQYQSPSRTYETFEGRVLRASPTEIVIASVDKPDGKGFTLDGPVKITFNGNARKSAKKLYAPEDLVGMQTKVLVRSSVPGQVAYIKATDQSSFGSVSLALIFILWTYAGWHEGAYVAAEVRNKRRNVPAALLIGTISVIVLYLAINTAYLCGLGYEDAADSKEVAADVLALIPRDFGEKAICILVIISSLGAINGMTFTSSRIYSEFGRDHYLFGSLGRWNPRTGTPIAALTVQGAVAVVTIILVALCFESRESFRALMDGTAPVFYLFFLLTGFALFALRWKDRGIERPFSVPLFPLTPLIYCAICALMLYGSIAVAWNDTRSKFFVLFTLATVLAGLPLFWLSQKMTPVTASGSEEPNSKTTNTFS